MTASKSEPGRVLIAGAAGFLGCHLARHYLDAGCQVVGVDNFVTGTRDNIDWLVDEKNFEFIDHDVTRPIQIDGPIDLVCDLACPASPVDFDTRSIEIMRVCAEGVWRMLELAYEKRAVFMHASTSEVYGDPEVNPQSEDYWGNVNPIGARSVYDEGKRYAEALIMAYHRRYDLPVRLARIFNTYGPRMRADDGRVVSNFINQALAGEPLTVHGDGSQTRSFCYVSDMTSGLAAVAGCDYNGPINVGNPDETPIERVAHEVIELTGSSSRIVHRPMPQDDPKVRQPDITLAKKLLRWRPKVDRREGLKKTIEFFRSKKKAEQTTPAR